MITSSRRLRVERTLESRDRWIHEVVTPHPLRLEMGPVWDRLIFGVATSFTFPSIPVNFALDPAVTGKLN